jgi:hypothetical protein
MSLNQSISRQKKIDETMQSIKNTMNSISPHIILLECPKFTVYDGDEEQFSSYHFDAFTARKIWSYLYNYTPTK